MPTRGEYEVVVGKDSYNLKEGDIIMINSGVVHGMRFVSQGRTDCHAGGTGLCGESGRNGNDFPAASGHLLQKRG